MQMAKDHDESGSKACADGGNDDEGGGNEQQKCTSELDRVLMRAKEEPWNREAVLAAVISGRSLQSASDAMKNDFEVVAAAVRRDWRALKYASPALRNSRPLLKIAVEVDGRAMQCTSNAALLHDKELWALAVSSRGCSLTFAPPSIQNDKKIVLLALAENYFALGHASKALRENPFMVLAAVKQGAPLSTVPKWMREGDRERDLVLAAVRVNGLALECAAKILQADRDVVQLAVAQNPRALMFASEKLRFEELHKNIRTLLSERMRVKISEFAEVYNERFCPCFDHVAGAQGGSSGGGGGIDHAHLNFNDLIGSKATLMDVLEDGNPPVCEILLIKHDPNSQSTEAFAVLFKKQTLNPSPPPDVLPAASLPCPPPLPLPPPDARVLPSVATTQGVVINTDVCKDAGGGGDLDSASGEVCDDREVVFELVSKRGGLNLEFASARLRGDRHVVRAAVGQAGRALQFASSALKADREVCLMAVMQDPWALEYASAELRDNKNLVIAAVAFGGLTLQFASPNLQADVDLVKLAVENCGLALMYAGPELKKHPEIAELALSQDPRAANFLAPCLRAAAMARMTPGSSPVSANSTTGAAASPPIENAPSQTGCMPTSPATAAGADAAVNSCAAASTADSFSNVDYVSSQMTVGQGWTSDILKMLWKTSQPIRVSNRNLQKKRALMTLEEKKASTIAAYQHLFRRWQATQVQDGNELTRWEALSALEKLETDDTNDLRTQYWTQKFAPKNGGGSTIKQPFLLREVSRTPIKSTQAIPAILPELNNRDTGSYRKGEGDNNCGDSGGGNSGGGGSAAYGGSTSLRSLVEIGLGDHLEALQYEAALMASYAPSSSLPMSPATMADADAALNAGAAASMADIVNSDADYVSSLLAEGQGWTPGLLKKLWRSSQPINVSNSKLKTEFVSMTLEENKASMIAAYRHLFKRWQATQVQDGNELTRWEALSALEKMETNDINDLRTQRFTQIFSSNKAAGPTHKQPFLLPGVSRPSIKSTQAIPAILPVVSIRDPVSEAGDLDALAYERGRARAATDPWNGRSLVAVAGVVEPTVVAAGEVAVVEVRAGLGQLSAAAEAAGARVYGVLEADPVARAILRERFPAAGVAATVSEAVVWSRPKEANVLIFATVPHPSSTAETAPLVASLVAQLGATVVVVAVLNPNDEEGCGQAVWDAVVSTRGLRRTGQWPLLNAATLGGSQYQPVGLLVYTTEGASGKASAAAFVERSPSAMRPLLRCASEVPVECSLGGLFEAKLRRSETPLCPLVVGRLSLGGVGVELFRGALVKLKATANRKWRVVGCGPKGRVELVELSGKQRLSVAEKAVSIHLIQKVRVASIDGPSNQLVAASSAPSGPGNIVILDDRLAPPRARWLLDDECFRVQGLEDAVYESVRRQLPNDEARRAGLAGRGVATVMAAEMVRRALEAVQSLGNAAVEVRPGNGDRCAGGGRPAS